MQFPLLAVALEVVRYMPHAAPATQSPGLEPWQVINLTGAPLIALIFLPTAVSDLESWIRGRGQEKPRRGRRR